MRPVLWHSELGHALQGWHPFQSASSSPGYHALLNQLPANAPGEAGKDGPGTCSSATHVEDQDGVANTWLGPVPDLIVAIWRANQQMEDLPVYCSAFQINV